MLVLYAIAAGLFIVAMLLAAGIVGFALAQAPHHRPLVLALSVSSMVLIGATGGVLASALYTKGRPVAITTGFAVSPSAVPSLSSVAETSPVTGDNQTPASAADAWMHFQSDSGDYIGGGQQKVWTITESDFTVGGSDRDIRASASGRGDWWYLEFRAPSNGHLAPGLFTNAERAPFVTGKAPGLEISGDGRGCNVLSGQFEVKKLTWTASGAVGEMDVVFEQHCEQGAPALRGELWVTTQSGVHKTPPAASSSVGF